MRKVLIRTSSLYLAGDNFFGYFHVATLVMNKGDIVVNS